MPMIEHIALWSDDIERLARFYADHFGARVGDKYTNVAKGFESRFLSFDDGARLEVMKSSTLNPIPAAPGAQRIGFTHLAFSLGAEARVDELTEILRRSGCPILDGPRRTGDGYYESVVLDPDGNRLELTV
jgi:lactoylglutathione lyase